MTCIVGLIDNDTVYIGGDAASVDSGAMYATRVTPKVFRNGDFVMGYTSSFRMGQLLQYKFIPPVITGDDLHKYMCTDFSDAIRDLMKNNGYSKIRDNEETAGNFLVGIRDELFEVQEDFHVTKHLDPFAAVGCGREYALGVCHTLYDDTSIEAADIVTAALEAAEHFSIGVMSPFTIVKNTS